MVIRQLPVNSSAPVKTTVIRPKGKSRPLARRAREGRLGRKMPCPLLRPHSDEKAGQDCQQKQPYSLRLDLASP